MKMKTLTLSLFVTLFAFTACKKDSKTTEPNNPNNDLELLGPETGKALHYSFNGNLNDGSGNNLTASSNSTVTYAADRFGRPNQAVVFTGASNPYAIATPSIASKITGFPFAMSLWIKPTAVSGSQTLVRTAGGESANYSGAWLQLGVGGEGTMSFSFGNNTTTSSSGRSTITTSALFSANNWYHVVINVRGSGDMDVYVNGVKDNAASYSGSATSMVYDPNNATGVLGVYPGFSSNYDGLMDDYRLYSKELSATEVATLYNFHP